MKIAWARLSVDESPAEWGVAICMPIGFGRELTQRHRGTERGEAQKGKKGRGRGAA
jgi:hypothetical protein